MRSDHLAIKESDETEWAVSPTRDCTCDVLWIVEMDRGSRSRWLCSVCRHVLCSGRCQLVTLTLTLNSQMLSNLWRILVRVTLLIVFGRFFVFILNWTLQVNGSWGKQVVNQRGEQLTSIFLSNQLSINVYSSHKSILSTNMHQCILNARKLISNIT